MKSTRPVLPSSTYRTENQLPPTNGSGTASTDRHVFKGWMLLPLRLFLGLTFVYAGIQKLTDPQFFNQSAAGYIGKQILAYAQGSPLHDFMINVALPHATLFGWLVALGEIAIGLATLAGLLLRPAAFFGLLISTTFFLTASWGTYPYFFGPDIVFMFCWLTLLLTGPLPTGLPALDLWLVKQLPSENTLSRVVSLVLIGTSKPFPSEDDTTAQTVILAGRNTRQQRISLTELQNRTRRSFLGGALAGGATLLGLTVAGFVLHVFGAPTTSTRGDMSASTSTAATPTTAASTTPEATTTPTPAGQVIAQVSAIPTGSSTTFTLADGHPGVLVHLANDSFVAYDATCTHRGCTVAYDASSQDLACPCHGSKFDPANAGAVLNPPASTALTSVSIHVDSATGTITLA